MKTKSLNKKSLNKKRALPLLLASLFFISGLWLAFKTFKELDAWALTTRVESDVEIFKAQFGSDAQPEWAKGTIAAAEKAVLRAPLDTDRIMQAGLVWTYIGHMEKGSLDRRRAFNKAISYYEQARELRPAWPHHYRNLHNLYFLTQRPVSDRNKMLLETYKYGKWNRSLKLFILEHTLARPWDLDAEMEDIEQQILDFLVDSRDRDSQNAVAALRARYPSSFNTAVAVGQTQ